MRVLITGGTGLVGKNLQDLLKKCFSIGVKYYFVSSRDCDLRDKNAVDMFIGEGGFDGVIHLAARVGGLFENMKHGLEMFHENMDINMNLLMACNKYGIQRGIFCLSSCIFPADPPRFPMTEDMLHAGQTHSSNRGYAHAKRLLHVLCEMYNKEYNRNYICVSPVNLYGPYDNFNIESGHVLPAAMHRMYLRKCDNADYQLWGTGAAHRQFLHARDFARAILVIMDDHDVKGGIFNICPPSKDSDEESEHEIGSLVYLIADELDYPSSRIQLDPSKSDGIIKKTVSGKKFRVRYPNFTFTSLNKGISETVAWMINNFEEIRK